MTFIFLYLLWGTKLNFIGFFLLLLTVIVHFYKLHLCFAVLVR